jgi:hypothetical protein
VHEIVPPEAAGEPVQVKFDGIERPMLVNVCASM